MLLPNLNTINFISWDQFQLDVREWERTLPYFDAICGIPTSGMYPAAYIAMQRNIHMVYLSDLLNGAILMNKEKALWLDKHHFRYQDNKPAVCNKILVVDDSSTACSNTISWIRDRMPSFGSDIYYGAVYRETDNQAIDFSFRRIPQVRLFEWNWLKHWILRSSLVDMDGVLCEDWLGDEVNEATLYEHHMSASRPLYKPMVKLKAIVTNRLEKYRSATIDWLDRHNVQYDQLLMHTADSAQDRRSAERYTNFKSMMYADDLNARLFIESDDRQAMIIASRTQKPVLCTDSMRVY